MSAPTADSVSLVDSRTRGAPTAVFHRADGRQFYLHSRYDPPEEARFLVKDTPCRERTMYVVLGFGLGYHVKELLRRIPRTSHVLVIEPDSACLSARLLEQAGSQATAWMHNARLHFLARQDPMVVPIYLADHCVKLRLLALELVTHLPSTMTAADFYQTLRAEIPQKFPTSFYSHLNSLDRMLENDLLNFWANLPYSWKAAPVELLHRKWAGRPLIIVSSGPSLMDALPLLHEVGGRALLLATGPAARILMAEGVRPDMVVSIDPYDPNQEHFKGWDTSDVPLAYYHRINRGVLTLYVGPKFHFVMQDEPALPLIKSGERSTFRRGGSVAFSALQLAHCLEADPVIFVGQDFAFVDGHTHATASIDDVPFDAGAVPKDCFFVPGVGGTPVLTNRTYHSYLLYMQNYLQDFARVKPGTRHINTSRVGARIDGMEYLTLESALAALVAPIRPSPRESTAAAHSGHRPVAGEMKSAALNRWSAELDRLLHQAGQSGDFDRLFARFKATSLYAPAARSYDDIYYLYEARYRGENDLVRVAFLSRFKEHLRFVFDELLKMGASV